MFRDPALEQFGDIFVADRAAGDRARDDLRLRLDRPDRLRRDRHQFDIDRRFFRLDHLAQIGDAQEARVRLVPHFPVEHAVLEMFRHGLAVIGPAADASLPEAGRREEIITVRRQRFGFLHVDLVAETEAEPGLDPCLAQAVDDLVQPGEVVFAFFLFRPLPSGLQPRPFHARIAGDRDHLAENVSGPVVEQFEADAERGAFDFLAGMERHVRDEFQFGLEAVVTRIEEKFLVFFHFLRPGKKFACRDRIGTRQLVGKAHAGNFDLAHCFTSFLNVS